jgi:hypothetical protein
MLKITIICVFFVSATLLLSGCKKLEVGSMEPVYYYNGGEIYELDQRKKERRSIYSSNKLSIINNLVLIDDGLIVFSECSVRGACLIKSLSISNGKTITYSKGKVIAFNKESRILLLEESDGIIAGEVRSIIDLENVERFSKLNLHSKKSNRLPIEIGDMIFNFRSKVYISKDGEVWSSEYKHKNYASVSDNGCFPLLWLNEKNKILCYSLNFKSVFLFDLGEGVKKSLPILNGAYGFIYESSNSSLLYGKTEGSIFGEKYSIYKYNLISEEEDLILKRSHLSGGGV